MTIPFLPTEIRMEIIRNISTKKEILNLAICDSTFCHLCQPLLYRWFRLQPDDAADAKQIIQWCKTILRNPRLASYVRELEFDGHRRKVPQWRAGGAMEQLIFNAFGRLKNLEALHFSPNSRTRLAYLFGAARLHFPLLEFFEGFASYSFLSKHNALKKLYLWELLPDRGQKESETCGILPDLICYSGDLNHIKYFHPLTRLQRLSVYVGIPNGEQSLSVLSRHGHSLLALHLGISYWKGGDFATIATLVPNLEALQIELGFVSPMESGKPVINDMLNSKPLMPSLRSLYLHAYNMFSHGNTSSIDTQQAEYVHLLHQSFPSLRTIHMSSPPFDPRGSCAQEGWRYNEQVEQWIPPESYRVQQRASLQERTAAVDLYQDALPSMSGIHAPLVEWHRLI